MSLLEAIRAYFAAPAKPEPSIYQVERVARRLCIVAGLDFDKLPEKASRAYRRANPRNLYFERAEVRHAAREYLIDGGRA